MQEGDPGRAAVMPAEPAAATARTHALREVSGRAGCDSAPSCAACGCCAPASAAPPSRQCCGQLLLALLAAAPPACLSSRSHAARGWFALQARCRCDQTSGLGGLELCSVTLVFVDASRRCCWCRAEVRGACVEHAQGIRLRLIARAAMALRLDRSGAVCCMVVCDRS